MKKNEEVGSNICQTLKTRKKMEKTPLTFIEKEKASS